MRAKIIRRLPDGSIVIKKISLTAFGKRLDAGGRIDNPPNDRARFASIQASKREHERTIGG